MMVEGTHGLEGKIEAILGALSGKSAARPLKLDTVTYMGTEAKTIKEIAASNNVSTRVAAHYVMERKDEFTSALLEDADQELKALHHSDGGSGSCLVLTGSMEAHEALAYPGGTPATEIHMTLAYFGDRDDVTPRQVRSIQDTCKEFAGFNVLFEATLGGITRFSGEDEDALVVNVDSNLVHEMRQWIERELTGGYGVIIDKTHGFTPHITLGYLHHEDDMPIRRWTPRKFEFQNLEFWHGNYHSVYPLGARDTEEPESSSPTEAEPEAIDAISQEGAVPMRKDVHTGNGGRRKPQRDRKIIERPGTRGLMARVEKIRNSTKEQQ